VDTTHLSLLVRLRDPNDREAWEEFQELYGPLMYRLARSLGAGHDDAEDVQASCYCTVVEKIRSFEYDAQRSGFRAWLFTLVRRRMADLFRGREHLLASPSALTQIPDDTSSISVVWDAQWREQHLRHCLRRVRQRVAEQSFQIFEKVCLDEVPVDDVCRAFHVSRNQVYKIRARILQMVREEARRIDPELQL